MRSAGSGALNSRAPAGKRVNTSAEASIWKPAGVKPAARLEEDEYVSMRPGGMGLFYCARREGLRKVRE